MQDVSATWACLLQLMLLQLLILFNDYSALISLVIPLFLNIQDVVNSEPPCY